MRILLVDDNHDAIANMTEYLELQGHDVDLAYQGQAAIALQTQDKFDVIVLDVMMPGIDGLRVCQHIRQAGSRNSATPIIFVTARDTLEDKLAGFDAGGDDYLVKPFALAELNARLLAIYQRGQNLIHGELSFGGLSYCQRTDEVNFHQQTIELDPFQKKLLRLLLQRAPATVDSQDIAYEIWQQPYLDSSALRTLIYRLRKALPSGMLKTVRGKGYRLVAAS